VWSLVKASSSVGPAHFRATRFSVPSPGEAIDRDGEMTPPVNVESPQTHVRRVRPKASPSVSQRLRVKSTVLNVARHSSISR
jgi:hypothetical protein